MSAFSGPKLLRITTVPISLKLLLQGQLTFMRENGYQVLTASADGAELAELKNVGVEHRVIPMTRRITPMRDMYCLLLLVRLIRKFQPDIVHTHTPKAGLLGMVASWLCGVRIRLHTVAGLPYTESKSIRKKILRAAEGLTYRCATRIYPNSEGLLDFMRRNFKMIGKKFHMIGHGSSNGIDTVLFSVTSELLEEAMEIRKRHSIGPNELVFSFVGRIVKDKGVDELVEAFSGFLLNRRAKLLVIGAFEENNRPLRKETIRFLRENPSVVLAGFREDVRPWLLASNVMVFPSYREGFPNVVMQASCLEVPCIVSNINGCNEIIQDEVTGRIVPSKDVPSLLRAMIELSEDEATRSRYGKKAREFVAARFEQRFIWKELLKEYARLLESTGAEGDICS